MTRPQPLPATAPCPVDRVLFVISSFRISSTGNGGHYYSMREMIAALDVDFQVLVIGDFFPPALKGLDNVVVVECAFNSPTGPDFSRVDGLVAPDIVHAYDLTAGCFSAILSWKWKVPFVYTKPGGPPYSRATPFFDNTIVFHQGDMDNIQHRPRPPRNPVLISNRVTPPPELDASPAGAVFDGMPDGVRIIAINRIGPAYEHKIRQAIRLRQAIAERTGAAVLCIIGNIQDPETYDRLCETAGDRPEIRFLTDPKTTYRAARHLPSADVVVGSGRGFMEAMAAGKPVFFEVRDTALPCFADAETYPAAFAENFSPRVAASDTVAPDAALDRFLAMRRSPAALDAHDAWTRAQFAQDHDITVGARKVMAFYQSLSGHESWLSARAAPVRIWLNGLIKYALRRLRG